MEPTKRRDLIPVGEEPTKEEDTTPHEKADAPKRSPLSNFDNFSWDRGFWS